MGMLTRKKEKLAAAMDDETMQYAIAKSEAAAAATTKWLDDHKCFVAALATALALPVPALAADGNATSTFNSVKDLISTGLEVVGGGMVVFGAVTVGMNVSGAAQGNGGAIGAGIATMVGGAVIAVAGGYFSTIGDLG